MSIARNAIAAGLLIAAVAGCSDIVIQDVPGSGTFGPQPSDAPTASAFSVDAGPDLFVALPDRSLGLRAMAANSDTVVDIRWTKMTGPASYRISRADGYTPEIADLEKGIYTFEVVVRDGAGRAARDTLAVHVVDSSAIQTVDFLHQVWSCPLQCVLFLGKFGGPSVAPMRVQVRLGGATTWEEARAIWSVKDRFYYSLYKGDLLVYSNDFFSPSDVRVLRVVP